MRCPRCREEIPADAEFCPECGAKLTTVCAQCGTLNAPRHKFCKKCGQPLALNGASAALATQFASPQSYTPGHLIEKILTSRSALEGERKQVTVLFADLKGSLELLADRDPEEARKLLDPVLERMMEAVHRYEGTVNQVMGDGIMALFGAPLAHEDHAVRACYAALRMQDSVKQYAEEIHRSVGVPIHIRVGLNSGEVVVRSIGSDLRMDYTAVGQTTHLAARMEQMAMPGSILITPETLNFVEGYVVVKPLGQRPIKGLETAVEVYEVVGASTTRSRFHAAAARGLTRFVGREGELEQLRDALDRARAGHGQLVAVVGEPGVGKSRLFWEFARSHRTQGWLVLESSSVSYGKATSYLPVMDLLKAYFQIEARDETREVREKVTGKVLSLDRALRAALPALLWLLQVPVEEAEWEALDPPQRRQRTLQAIKGLLLRESQVQPLLLVFEDLHWIDSETQALLDGLVESLPTARVLLLVNYRPEYQHTWSGKTYYRQLQIVPLPPEGAEHLLEALLGSDASLQSVKQLLIDRTEGNPFFLEEIVRALVETNSLAGVRGAYRLATSLQRLQIPPTAKAILAARIDRLSPQTKRLLQAAAVIGTDVPFVLLKAITVEAEDMLRWALAELQAAEFLYETCLFPDLEYTFKHALTHEVAYDGLLQDRRRTLHAQIVMAAEALYSDRLGEQIEQLAHHAFRGETWTKAAAYLKQAGAKAMGRSALREAVTWFEQALVALAHLPDSRDTREQAIDTRFDLRNVLLQLGEHERMFEHLREAEALAKALDDQPRLARVCAYLTTTFVMAGDYDHALEYGQRAVAICEALSNVPLAGEMDFRLGQVYHSIGDYRRAIAILRRRIEFSAETQLHGRFTPPFLISVFSRAWLGLCLAEVGEFAEGIARLEEAVPVAHESEQPFNPVGVYQSLALLHLRRADLHQAIPVLERGFALSQAKNVQIFSPILGSMLGIARCRSGAVAEGIPLLEGAARAAQKVLLFRSQVVANLSEGYLLAHRRGEALEVAGRALEIARAHNEKGYRAWALHLLGQVMAHPDPTDVEAAEAHYLEALAIATDLGMRPLVAHCHLGLGKLYRHVGKRAQAPEHLKTATTMYREMEMGFWLEQAEAAMQDVTGH